MNVKVNKEYEIILSMYGDTPIISDLGHVYSAPASDLSSRYQARGTNAECTDESCTTSESVITLYDTFIMIIIIITRSIDMHRGYCYRHTHVCVCVCLYRYIDDTKHDTDTHRRMYIWGLECPDDA
jgi:hypothetical protein